jgi:hypothetical protein
MRHLLFAIVLSGAVLLGSAGKKPAPADSCTPAYFELQEPLVLSVGASELTFRLLVIGCHETLVDVWPPSKEALERGFLPELSEPHPVQILMMIRDRSPELRARLVDKLNEFFEKNVVYDVFLFDAKAAE